MVIMCAILLYVPPDLYASKRVWVDHFCSWVTPCHALLCTVLYCTQLCFIPLHRYISITPKYYCSMCLSPLGDIYIIIMAIGIPDYVANHYILFFLSLASGLSNRSMQYLIIFLLYELSFLLYQFVLIICYQDMTIIIFQLYEFAGPGSVAMVETKMMWKQMRVDHDWTKCELNIKRERKWNDVQRRQKM